MNKFIVWRPDYGSKFEDGREIAARSHEHAAREWAQRDDAESAEYLIVRGNDAVLHVTHPDGSQLRIFRVTGESIPQYYARDITAIGD